MKKSILTIAIPVFERKDFFEKALQSCLNQTINCDIFVVDNASSHDFFQQQCLLHNVKYYRNSSNIGLFSNWNRCFELSDTEFVLILSDDDILENTYVEKFYKAISEYPEIDIFYSDFSILNYPSKQITYHNHTFPWGFMKNGNEIIEYGIKYDLGFPIITSAIRKSKFDGFHPEYGCNDWLWLYSNVKNLKLYGENKILLKRGHHYINTFNKSENYAYGVLSIAYLYEKILFKSVENKKLKRKAKFKAYTNLINYIGLKCRNISIQNSKTIFDQYFLLKLKSNIFLRIINKLPHRLILFIYKVLQKLRIIK